MHLRFQQHNEMMPNSCTKSNNTGILAVAIEPRVIYLTGAEGNDKTCNSFQVNNNHHLPDDLLMLLVLTRHP